MSPDAVGHMGYAFVFAGMMLLANEYKIGWIFRVIGDIVWVTVGFMTGMTSLWTWGLAFVLIDLWGLCRALQLIATDE